MQDVHIEALVGQYRDTPRLTACPVVQEFRCIDVNVQSKTV